MTTFIFIALTRCFIVSIVAVAALYLQRHPDWTAKDVWTAIESHALRDLVSNVPPSTPNLIISTGGLLFP